MSDEDSSDDSAPRVLKNAYDLQRMKLEKLMKNPEKPVVIPERPKEKKPLFVPDFVRNVMGSSAGAGSGEFHVYRHLRRKEYARQKMISEMSEKEKLDYEYQERMKENKKKLEEKTAKKRQKRLKKKAKRKEKLKMRKLEKPKTQESTESESSDSGSNDEKSEDVKVPDNSNQRSDANSKNIKVEETDEKPKQDQDDVNRDENQDVSEPAEKKDDNQSQE